MKTLSFLTKVGNMGFGKMVFGNLGFGNLVLIQSEILANRLDESWTHHFQLELSKDF